MKSQSKRLKSNVLIVQTLYAMGYRIDQSYSSVLECFKELNNIDFGNDKSVAGNLLSSSTNCFLDDSFSEFSDELTIISSVLKSQNEIDQIISDNLVNTWCLERLPLIVTYILRIAIHDIQNSMQEQNSIKIGRIISDYLQVTKIFGHEKEVSFVNGILDQIYKQILDAKINKKILLNKELHAEDITITEPDINNSFLIYQQQLLA